MNNKDIKKFILLNIHKNSKDKNNQMWKKFKKDFLVHFKLFK